jgi:hypothetical protein
LLGCPLQHLELFYTLFTQVPAAGGSEDSRRPMSPPGTTVATVPQRACVSFRL